ncbi:MAG: hypothetical protein WC786_03315 [Patescibacteria group bacterium]
MFKQDQDLLAEVLKQGAAKHPKTPETVAADFDQQKMYAEEAAARQRRAAKAKQKKRKR